MRFLLAALCAFALAIPGAASAQSTYPDRLVHMIVPFSPGGGTDIIARLVAQKLSEAWGQSVIVENKTGANGNIGARYASVAKPDGYTILVSTSALTINPWLHEEAGYKLTDFTPVILLASSPFVLLVNPKMIPATTLPEFIAFAKSKDGQVAWASTSEGNAEHLAGSLLQQMGGFKMRHIPYKGGSDAIKDVMGGQVEVGVISLPSSLAYVSSGQLRAIAVTDLKRAPQLPNVPTVAESGIPGFELPTWYAVWVPNGTPAPIIDKIYNGIRDALRLEDVQKRVLEIGFRVGGGPRAEFADYVNKESDRYSKMITSIGLQKQ